MNAFCVVHRAILAGQVLTAISQVMGAMTSVRRNWTGAEKKAMRKAMHSLSQDGFELLNLVVAEISYRKTTNALDALLCTTLAEKLDDMAQACGDELIRAIKPLGLSPRTVFGAVLNPVRNSGTSEKGGPQRFTLSESALKRVPKVMAKLTHDLLQIMQHIAAAVFPVIGYAPHERDSWVKTRRAFQIGQPVRWRSFIRYLDWDEVFERYLGLPEFGGAVALTRPCSDSRARLEQLFGPADEDPSEQHSLLDGTLVPANVTVSTDGLGRLLVQATLNEAPMPDDAPGATRPAKARIARFLAQIPLSRRAALQKQASCWTCTVSRLPDALQQAACWEQEHRQLQTSVLRELDTYIKEGVQQELAERFEAQFSADERACLLEIYRAQADDATASPRLPQKKDRVQ